MEEHEIRRSATRLIQKYGKKALPKTVEVARYYLSERDEENAKRWVTIGMEIKRQQRIDSVKDILETEDEAR